jgi:hypothetical protein
MSWLCCLGLHDLRPLVLDLNYGSREDRCLRCGREWIRWDNGPYEITGLTISQKMSMSMSYGIHVKRRILEFQRENAVAQHLRD